MREIKFKAWVKHENTMRLVKSVNYADDGFAKTVMVQLVGGNNSGYVHGESCELLQYTGSKDNNGAEIYEGDIVNVGDISTPSKVIYEKSCFYTPTLQGNYRVGSWENIEVIGNIYENPELLNLPKAIETTE